MHREIEHVRPEVDVLTAPECVLPDMSLFTNDASPSPDSVEVVTKHRQRPLVNKFAKVCVTKFLDYGFYFVFYCVAFVNIQWKESNYCCCEYLSAIYWVKKK